MPEHYDVVICGAGLVGLTLANCLNQSQLQVAVIDAQSAPALPELGAADLDSARGTLDSGYAPRVSAINLKSARLLDRFGIWQAVRRSESLVGMSIWDSSGTSQLSFQAGDIQEDRLGYIVENREVVYALNANLADSPNVSLLWQCSLDDLDQTDTGYILELEDGTELSCDLLVGADGGNSRIRTLSQIKTVKWPYGQNALVTTIQTEKPHQGIARQWFTDEGPLAFLPLADPNLCSIVWSLSENGSTKASENGSEESPDPATYLEESERDFCQRLSSASEGELGDVLGSDRRFSFPLVQQHCFRYVQKNLALIGDAAHTIHPLAGQGANLGFADAAELAQVILQCPMEGTHPGDLSVLQSYERARQPHNLAMTSLMELLKRLYGTQDSGLNWLRNKTMHLIEDSGVAKKLATRVASGLI